MEGEGEAEALLRRRFHIAMALAAFIGHPSHFQVSLGGALALLANGAWETRSRTPDDAPRLGCPLVLPGIRWTIGFRNVIAMFHELGGDLRLCVPAEAGPLHTGVSSMGFKGKSVHQKGLMFRHSIS
jgi:hypothetical protein